MQVKVMVKRYPEPAFCAHFYWRRWLVVNVGRLTLDVQWELT